MTDTRMPEPWQLYPMPPEQVAKIRQYIARMTGPATWRIQWYSRRDIGERDREMGRHDFPTEAAARAYLDSEEVQSRVGPFWRVELQCQGPWVTVEAGEYAQEVEA